MTGAERNETSNEHVWDSDAGEDSLGPFAARDCPGCEALLTLVNFVRQPLHDGEGNYYRAYLCPHCGEVLYRLRIPDTEELTDEAKADAERDPEPPENLESLDEVAL